MEDVPFGFNVFGYVSGTFGLAAAARNTIQLLLENDFDVAVWDVQLADGRSGKVHTYADLRVDGKRPLPYPINLFHMNPPEVDVHMTFTWAFLGLDRMMNVIVPFWELPSLPTQWQEVLGVMDAVLAPSAYIEETIRAALPDQCVLHFPQAICLPDVSADRERWGLLADQVAFLVSFDMASDIERKNPWAAIDAFQRAFGEEDDVVLLVKVANARLDQRIVGQVDALRRVAESNKNVRLLEEQLSYDEVLQLYASCDVIVSLHRAEGLGLVAMEAMYLGKPVIATGWSGNMDFMSEENSCLVGYEMVDVKATLESYRRAGSAGAVQWAEPKVGEAADWMRRLANDRPLRERIGRRAAADMRERYSEYRRGEVFVEVQRLYEDWRAADQRNRKTQAFRRLRFGRQFRLLPRVPRALVRRAGRLLSRARRRG